MRALSERLNKMSESIYDHYANDTKDELNEYEWNVRLGFIRNQIAQQAQSIEWFINRFENILTVQDRKELRDAVQVLRSVELDISKVDSRLKRFGGR